MIGKELDEMLEDLRERLLHVEQQSDVAVDACEDMDRRLASFEDVEVAELQTRVEELEDQEIHSLKTMEKQIKANALAYRSLEDLVLRIVRSANDATDGRSRTHRGGDL